MTTTDTAVPATSAAIRADLEANAVARREAEAEFARLQAARPAMLLDLGPKADAALAAHDAAMAKASRTVERTAALAEKLAADLDAARHAEYRAARRVQHDAAKAAAAEAEAFARATYPEAAAAIVAVLKRLEEAHRLVDKANHDRPDGFERIDDPEAFRGRPATPGYTTEETVEVWTDTRTGERFPCRPVMIGGGRDAVSSQPYRCHTETKTVTVSGSSAWIPTRLASDVRLPGLHREADPWNRKTSSW